MWCVCVYGAQTFEENKMFRTQLDLSSGLTRGKHIVLGDFNYLEFDNEKLGGK